MPEDSLNRIRRAGKLVQEALKCVEQTARTALVANDTVRESLIREIRV